MTVPSLVVKAAAEAAGLGGSGFGRFDVDADEEDEHINKAQRVGGAGRAIFRGFEWRIVKGGRDATKEVTPLDDIRQLPSDARIMLRTIMIIWMTLAAAAAKLNGRGNSKTRIDETEIQAFQPDLSS